MTEKHEEFISMTKTNLEYLYHNVGYNSIASMAVKTKDITINSKMIMPYK